MTFQRFLSAVVALGAAALGAACDDTTGLEAQFETEVDTFVVYALTGTPPELPTAYSSVARPPRVMRVDSLAFDVAFDLTADGQVAIYPVSLIGQPSSGRQVGIRTDTVGFERLQRAPSRGYVSDSVIVVPVGRTVVLQAPGDACTIYSLSPYVYTKFVVDAVDLAARRISFHAVHNPNCGFRSFRPGIPED